MLREGAEEATMPTKGQPKKATTSEDSSGTTEARPEADSNLAEKFNPNKKPLKVNKLPTKCSERIRTGYHKTLIAENSGVTV